MVAHNLFILFFDRGAGLNPGFVSAYLLLESRLLLPDSCYALPLRANLILELPKLRRVCTIGNCRSLRIGAWSPIATNVVIAV